MKPKHSTDYHPSTSQTPKNPIFSLFMEIEKIPGSFPVLSPKDYILVYEKIVTIKDGTYYIYEQYEPDNIICFDTEPELINYLLSYYNPIGNKK